ncbi:helix-turn-helix domain-containing protein [Plantactinospora soyae]|uniref:Transcriptional regulator with XRE-family HTH domain n=1 Tax=Plantactinospora soyae TaxID=1544732 RepID=A0A927QUK3_9ACTN|nr:helix-turn-helix transcriptional regulator [Plantactinospora soyae]MBE1484665.1 transcriptional regulator with XRE-family HTH domain [Plantactinospora soyae]
MDGKNLPTLTAGQRIRLHRERTGKTRAILGGLVGRSAEWVKAVENNRLLPPRLQMLSQIAKALRVDLATLTGSDEPVSVSVGPGHAYLPAVREALNRWPIGLDTEPQPLSHIRARLDNAWRARHAAPDHRTVIGALLPGLIHDAQHAARVSTDRQQAYALLTEALGLTQMFLAYQPSGELVLRTVDRAMLAAQESGDPLALACATWFAAAAHRESGDWDTAMAVTLDAMRAIEPKLPDASDDLLASWGALQVEASHTAARAGEAGKAWHHLDIAGGVAKRLPEDFYQRWSSFSAVIMGPHAVTVEVELRKGGHALRQADRTDARAIPSRPRRARHLIEVARGHHLRNDRQATMGTLDLAYETAPETIRYNGYARSMVLELLGSPAAQRRPAHDLALKVGLAP